MTNATYSTQLKSKPAKPPFPPLEPQFPLLAQLRDLGMAAILRDGKICLAPQDRITPRMRMVIFQHRAEIVDEINRRDLQVAQDRAEATVATRLQARRWEDPRHNLDQLSELFAALFAHLARLSASSDYYWDGEPDPKPERPYCYVLPQDCGRDGFIYWPMLADVDGADYVMADVLDAVNYSASSASSTLPTPTVEVA